MRYSVPAVLVEAGDREQLWSPKNRLVQQTIMLHGAFSNCVAKQRMQHAGPLCSLAATVCGRVSEEV